MGKNWRLGWDMLPVFWTAKSGVSNMACGSNLQSPAVQTLMLPQGLSRSTWGTVCAGPALWAGPRTHAAHTTNSTHSRSAPHEWVCGTDPGVAETGTACGAVQLRACRMDPTLSGAGTRPHVVPALTGLCHAVPASGCVTYTTPTPATLGLSHGTPALAGPRIPGVGSVGRVVPKACAVSGIV